MKHNQKMDTKPADKPASKKHLILRVFSLGFLAVFGLTIVFGLLISGSSVALFTANSNTITMRFEAEAGQAPPSLQELLDILMDETISDEDTEGVLAGAGHIYKSSEEGNPNAWSIILQIYLEQRSPSDPNHQFRNPFSNKTLIYNQPILPTGDNVNPAVFITEYGNHINFSSGAPQSLWGSIIVYSTGNNPTNTQINYLFVDNFGNVSETISENLNKH